jgi:hypothetical protein
MSMAELLRRTYRHGGYALDVVDGRDGELVERRSQAHGSPCGRGEVRGLLRREAIGFGE